MFYIYILEDQRTKRKYIGFTEHLQQRLLQHKHGEVRTTKTWQQIRLINAEYYQHKLDTVGRERFLKSGAGWRFLKKQLQHYFSG